MYTIETVVVPDAGEILPLSSTNSRFRLLLCSMTPLFLVLLSFFTAVLTFLLLRIVKCYSFKVCTSCQKLRRFIIQSSITCSKPPLFALTGKIHTALSFKRPAASLSWNRITVSDQNGEILPLTNCLMRSLSVVSLIFHLYFPRFHPIHLCSLSYILWEDLHENAALDAWLMQLVVKGTESIA
ncbi:hypothetical protein GEMRC1_004170 [Eukaryota sp. GEM-RC1]